MCGFAEKSAPVTCIHKQILTLLTQNKRKKNFGKFYADRETRDRPKVFFFHSLSLRKKSSPRSNTNTFFEEFWVWELYVSISY